MEKLPVCLKKKKTKFKASKKKKKISILKIIFLKKIK